MIFITTTTLECTSQMVYAINRCVWCLCSNSGSSSYTNHTTTEIASYGCLCTSSRWFKHIKPHQIYTNNTITGIARCIDCLCNRLGWFNHIEHHRTYTNITIMDTYSAGSVGQNIFCGGFSETASFHSYGTSCIVRLLGSRPFSLREYVREPAIIRAVPTA